MRIFMLRQFSRFISKNGIAEADLIEAIARAQIGSVDADLGGGVIKQRIARAGAGKSGGYRTLIAVRAQDRAIYLYGYAKNDRENISKTELSALRLLAADLLANTEKELKASVKSGALVEIKKKN